MTLDVCRWQCIIRDCGCTSISCRDCGFSSDSPRVPGPTCGRAKLSICVCPAAQTVPQAAYTNIVNLSARLRYPTLVVWFGCRYHVLIEISVWRLNKRRDTATMRDEGLKLLQIRRDCVIHPSSGCFRLIPPLPELWSAIISRDCVIHLSIGWFRRTLRACRELLEFGYRKGVSMNSS